MKVLSRVFRGKFVEALRRAYDRNELDLAGGSEHLRDPAAWRAFVDALFETDWVVYAKPAFGGAPAVLRYLGRYTHRVAISNHRLLAFDGERVTVSVEGLRPWRPAPHDDALRDGVSPALRPTHSAARLRPHPPVGVSREHLPRRPRGPSRAPCSPHRTAGAGRRRDRTDDDRAPRPVRRGRVRVRRRDDPRADPLGAPTHDVTWGFDTS